MGGMTSSDGRLEKLENEVSSIKGSLDWAKIAFGILIAVTLGGFSLSVSMLILSMGMQKDLSSKFDSLRSTVTDEFRSQRSDQAAQVSAIANVITATKQQAPQVILVPAPTSEPSSQQKPTH